MVLVLTWLLAAAHAQAPAPAAPAAPAVSNMQDVYNALPPPGAKQWDPKPLVAAIGNSTFVFTPKHYYELVDKAAPADVTKAVAAKSGVFYDPAAVPMSTLAANARRGQPAQTISVTASDFAVLFEFFNDVQNEMTAAESRVPPNTPQGPTESISLYERRMRTRDEALVRARGPFEGRIEAATFNLDLPATVTERDGCKRSVTTMDMSSIPIELFRIGMGTRNTTHPIDVKGAATVETAQFTINAPRRFEVIGRCGTTGTKLKLTMKRTFDGKWTAQGGF